MFELNIAAKYLLPRWRRLSLSLISMIAMLVISLVVWLILVFFSVTNGLEKMWIEKLIVLTGPARVYPTDNYYKSYYYLIDTISSASDYQPKSIEEKLAADNANPWNENIDEEIPPQWPDPIYEKTGEPKDLLKELTLAIQEEPGLEGFIYEVAPATVKLRLERRVAQDEGKKLYSPVEGQMQQNAFLLSFDANNSDFKKNVIPLKVQDIDNFFKASTSHQLIPTRLQTPSYGWVLPRNFYPKEHTLTGVPVYSHDRLRYILIPNDPSTYSETITVPNNTMTPLVVEPNLPIETENGELKFQLQGHDFKGIASIYDLDVISVQDSKNVPWLHQNGDTFVLPNQHLLGDGVLLPKSFQDAGALVGDRGYILYESPSLASTSQVQLPFYVAGFYDPGIMAMGGKFILTSPDVASLVRSSLNVEPYPESNGIQLRYKNYLNIKDVKKRLQKRLEDRGIAPFFHIETYEEYDFAKGFIQELKSQKNVFLILAGMIILVACSNIISMLIILVNDKKKEIGILRALGARTLSIGSIFGLIGLSMGVIGSTVGILLSLITLHYLPALITLLSRLQGFDAFQRLFYNNTFPSTISTEALQFVIIATTLTSLLAAIIPAIKACTVKPAAMLRSE